MALFIEHKSNTGYEYETCAHLRLIAQNDGMLSFEQGLSNPLFPGSKFIKVNTSGSSDAPGFAVIEAAINNRYDSGDVFIFPQHFVDELTNPEGEIIQLHEAGGGFTIFFDTGMTIHRYIYYDATPHSEAEIDNIFYVSKNYQGECIEYPRYLILYHEMAHATSVGIPPEDEEWKNAHEDYAVFFENGFRNYLGLPVRKYSSGVKTIPAAEAANWCP